MPSLALAAPQLAHASRARTRTPHLLTCGSLHLAQERLAAMEAALVRRTLHAGGLTASQAVRMRLSSLEATVAAITTPRGDGDLTVDAANLSVHLADLEEQAQGR